MIFFIIFINFANRHINIEYGEEKNKQSAPDYSVIRG